MAMYFERSRPGAGRAPADDGNKLHASVELSGPHDRGEPPARRSNWAWAVKDGSRRDRLVAVVPNTHALSARATVRFEDLLPERVIPVESMLGMFRAAAKRLGAEFAPPFHVVSAGAAISLVQAGLGVTVLPECLLSHDMYDQVTSVAIDESWAVRTTHIATARGRNPSPPAAALMKQLLDRPRGEPAIPGQG